MALTRPVTRILPDGNIGKVMPFHISLEGLERVILCKCDADCDILVKMMALAARRKNVIVIIYAVVSNHAHIAVLARSYEEARAFGIELKKTYSMYFSKRYHESKTMHRTSVDVQFLDTD